MASSCFLVGHFDSNKGCLVRVIHVLNFDWLIYFEQYFFPVIWLADLFCIIHIFKFDWLKSKTYRYNGNHVVIYLWLHSHAFRSPIKFIDKCYYLKLKATNLRANEMPSIYDWREMKLTSESEMSVRTYNERVCHIKNRWKIPKACCSVWASYKNFGYELMFLSAFGSTRKSTNS